MSDTFSHDIDATDDAEITHRQAMESEILEHEINSMRMSDIVSAATSFLGSCLEALSDKEVMEIYDNIFNRELH